jgi:hypothetical protein
MFDFRNSQQHSFKLKKINTQKIKIAPVGHDDSASINGFIKEVFFYILNDTVKFRAYCIFHKIWQT